MNDKFDELARDMAQSINRRQAFKKLGVGLVGMALAVFGSGSRARAANQQCLPSGVLCKNSSQCCSGVCNKFHYGANHHQYHYGYCA